MSKIGLERLNTVAERLQQDNTGLDRFNFGVIYKATECGTLGCVMGSLPFIFPKEWRLTESGSIRLRADDNIADAFLEDQVCHFFEIDEGEASHLFFPTEQAPGVYGGELLWSDATAEQVAHNILEFIKIKEQEAL